jgi:hypothetical protein
LYSQKPEKTKMKTKVTSRMLRIYSMKAVAIAIILLSMASCKDDKDEKPANQFTVDGSAKAVKTALFIFDTQSSISDVDGQPYFRHELDLLTDGFTITGDDIDGVGSGLVLMINGSTINLDAGTYTFTGTEENPKAFELWEAYAYLDYNTDTGVGQELEFTAGKVTISKSGDIYTIDVEGTASGKAIKAHYTGAITAASGD